MRRRFYLVKEVGSTFYFDYTHACIIEDYKAVLLVCSPNASERLVDSHPVFPFQSCHDKCTRIIPHVPLIHYFYFLRIFRSEKSTSFYKVFLVY